ncbi:MAG: hypothetical protein OEV28_00270 [Nitrospirota bacterium]|nr:hypothetical protein [Nitrospirota bacterium]
MKIFSLFLLPVLLVGCQAKPQGETISLPATAAQTPAKNPDTPAETGKKDTSLHTTDDETSVYHKAVKIRVKRDPKNGYSWELTGDSVKDIVAMDKELRNKLLADEKSAPQ